MKKSYNPISDGNNEKNELTRRIYRSLSDVVRQLDDVRGRSKTISDLFLPCLASLKIKLHDLCYKLILTDPLHYGKKGEEILWKKGYHDVFTTAKRLRKNEKWSPEEASFVQGLLISGMGRYQHLLFKLQSEYKINVQGLIDFPLNISDLGIVKVKTSFQKSPDKSLEEWAKDSCHRCLIYLGDLNRYLLDVFPLWDSGTAERYYLQAANINTVCGRPFNQLGTLAGEKNYNLDAVYYYMRCLIRPESFEGTEANLRKTLDKNLESIQLDSPLSDQMPAVQSFISKFLLLFDFWYFEKSTDYNVNDLNQEILRDFQLSLSEEPENPLQLDENELELTNLTPFKNRILNNAPNLNTDIILKVIILCFICVEKLQKKDPQSNNLAISTCVEIFTQLLQTLTARFEKFYSDFGLVEKCLPETSKSDDHESDFQPKAYGPDKCKENVKSDVDVVNLNGHSGIQPEKKCPKYSEKTRNKKDFLADTKSNGSNDNEPDIKITENENTKDKTKKKNRLKTRKRVRPDSLCDSELSDSDITLNDSSSDSEYSSGESESDEVASSDSEGLDETLLIIDQKIKEKKLSKGQKNCELNGLSKNSVIKNDSKELQNGNAESNITDIKNSDTEMLNLIDQNGLRVSNDKDKTKSLFTILNGEKEHPKLNENSGGDFTVEEKTKSTNPLVDTIQFSELALTETNEHEHGDFSAKGKNEEIAPELDSKKLDVKTLLHFLSQQDMLKPLKIFFDWFTSNPEILKIFLKNSKQLMSKIVKFLNLLNMENEWILKDLNIRSNADNIPLSEDIVTRGLSMLQACQQKLDWDFHNTNILTLREEFILRIYKLFEFGHFLVKQEEAGVMFSTEEQLFYVAGQNGVTNPLNLLNEKELNNSTMRKGQLMKDMGQLWLKAEVRDLESRVRKKGGNFSPYLVIDTEALIEHIVLVKQLVGSRQFIVIIPTVVLSHLDECKRDSGRARETIRWLESQFQHGNRSLRAQKSQERFSLPLIKYPKKKDKEAWNFFQIVECCHYFSKQSEFQSVQSNLLVTLLTGQREISFASDNRKDDLGKDFSPVGVAQNFGINLEHIEAFHTKWKLSTKSHG